MSDGSSGSSREPRAGAPAGCFVSERYRDDCARFLAEVKRQVSRDAGVDSAAGERPESAPSPRPPARRRGS